MYGKILQRLLQNFFLTMGRAPITPMEWSKLRKQAMELARKEGGDPITGAKIGAPPKSLMDTTKDLPGIESLKNNPKIIPFPKAKSRNMTPLKRAMNDKGISALMGKGNLRLGEAPKTQKSTLDQKKAAYEGHVNKEMWIKDKIQQNKQAIERFKQKFGKKEPTTVEDLRDQGDWDPGGMNQGGIARLGYAFGGKALKAIMDAWRANKTWGVGGPPYKPEATTFDIKKLTKRMFGKELSLNELRQLEKSPFRGPGGQTFDQFNQGFKNIKAKVLKEKMMEQKLEAKAMIHSADMVPANTEIEKRVQAQFSREGKKKLAEAKEGLKEIDIYMGMLQKKGRSVHYAGGLAPLVGEPSYAADFYDDRTPFSGGGKAGLPAITYGMPQAGMQGPQMPAAPQPQGISGVNLQMDQNQLMQQQMMQNPWMQNNMQQGIGGTPQYKGQLRMPFAGGGMGRRAFLKFMASLGALPFIGRGAKEVVKEAPTAIKAAETITTTGANTGMPSWFPAFVQKVLKEGKDLTPTHAPKERVIVAETKLPHSDTPVYVEHDLVTGDTMVDIGMGKHGWSDGYHGQPTRLHLKKGEIIEEGKMKGQQTPDEFVVEEAEFTGGHPENVKFEESSFNNYGEHGSDFSELEEFATGKVTKESKAQKQVWEADWDDVVDPSDESGFGMASGGIARMLGE